MEKNEVKKYLYKNKELKAKFSHYVSGNLYYTVQLEDGLYQFPISTIEEGSTLNDVVLSQDLGTTVFGSEIKASELNRWIDKSIGKGEFTKLS
jgi:hypothetical protein